MARSERVGRGGAGWTCGLLVGLLLLWLPAGGALAADWQAQLRSIQMAGSEVGQAQVPVTAAGQASAQTRLVKTGERFASGTMLEAPARTQLVLATSNGNEIRMSPGSRLRLTEGSGSGEAYEQEAGSSRFLVRHALNMFNVAHRSFQAMARGTEYTVTVTPGATLSLQVEEGTVELRRDVPVQIEQGGIESKVTAVDRIQAGQERSYRLDQSEYIARFGTYSDAERYYRDNLQRDRAGGDERMLFTSLAQLGEILATLGRPDEAIPCFEEALALQRKIDPDDRDYMTAAALGELGSAYVLPSAAQDFAKGIALLKQSLAIIKALFPKGNSQQEKIATFNIGVAYARQGTPAAQHTAITYYERALAIDRAYFSDGVSDAIAFDLGALGGALGELRGEDNLRKSIKYFDASLAILDRLQDPGLAPYRVSILDLTAGSHWLLGGEANIRKALVFYQQALAIQMRLFPDGAHPITAGLYVGMGQARFKLDGLAGLDEATALQEKALALYRRFGDRLNEARVTAILGWYQMFRGDYDATLRACDASLALDPDLIEVHAIRAEALMLKGEREQSMAIYRRYQTVELDFRRRFRSAIMIDFRAMRAAGIDHPQMREVERLYGIDPERD